MWDSRLKQMAFTGYHVVGEVAAFGGMELWISENWDKTKDDCKTSTERWNDFTEMQFIGEKDKNGTDIYEGDIIKFLGFFHGRSNNQKWFAQKVIFRQAMFMPVAKDDKPHQTPDWKETEVIGNIFQNPELLNDGEGSELIPSILSKNYKEALK